LGPRTTEVSAPELVRQYRPTMTFSSAVMFANNRIFWNVRAMPARTTARGFGASGVSTPSGCTGTASADSLCWRFGGSGFLGAPANRT